MASYDVSTGRKGGSQAKGKSKDDAIIKGFGEEFSRIDGDTGPTVGTPGDSSAPSPPGEKPAEDSAPQSDPLSELLQKLLEQYNSGQPYTPKTEEEIRNQAAGEYESYYDQLKLAAQQQQQTSDLLLQQRQEGLQAAYDKQREQSREQYDQVYSKSDRQMLSRGMQRSSYAAQTLANISTEGAEAQQAIADQQAAAEGEIAQQRTLLAQQLAQQLAQYDASKAADVLGRIRELEEQEYQRGLDASDRQNSLSMQLYQLLYQQKRDEIEDNQWQQQFNESVRQYNASQSGKSSGGGGGSSGGYTGGYNGSSANKPTQSGNSNTTGAMSWADFAAALGGGSKADTGNGWLLSSITGALTGALAGVVGFDQNAKPPKKLGGHHMGFFSDTIGNILSSVGQAVGNAVRSFAAPAASAPPIQPTVPLNSARQRLMFQEEEEEKWFRGDEPTGGEIAARIFEIGRDDPAQGEQLWNAFARFQSDPSCPIYTPYSAPTNRAVKELSSLGFDMSGGVTDEWIQQNSWLKKHYRTGASGSPLAPSKESTPAQNAAYWYYQLLKDEGTTRQAEAEWAALQEEIGYWAGRKDRNYSDDEIMARIDWSNYQTLTRMDTDRQQGTPTSLNRAVGYSQDALYGTIWAARGNESTGNPFLDSVKYALGMGNGYTEDEHITAMLDPTSERYSPYAVGSTLDDAALYFGVSSFGPEWLEKNRSILGGKDATAKKMYQRVYEAEQTTKEAEAELAIVQGYVDDHLKGCSDPDVILNGVLYILDNDCPTLKKMDESLASGNLIATTRAVNYRWADLERNVRERCAAMNAAPPTGVYTEQVGQLLGYQAPMTGNDAAVESSGNNAINAAAPTIMEMGTEEEKHVWRSGYSSNFETCLLGLNAAMNNGTADSLVMANACRMAADKFANAHYLDTIAVTRPYEQAKGELEAARQELEGILSQESDQPGLPEQARKAELETRIPELESYMQENADAYAKAQKELESIQARYATVERMRALAGDPGGKRSGSSLAIMDYVYQYGAAYKPTEYATASLYDLAMQEGYTYGQTAQAARAGLRQNRDQIERLNWVLGEIEKRGITVDQSYRDNIQREKSKLERDVKDAEYFLVRGRKDFASTVEVVRKDVLRNPPVPFGHLAGGYSSMDLYAADPTRDFIVSTGGSATYMPSLTQEERDTYLYLLATEGADSARAYYDHLTDSTYGVIPVRQYTAGQANLKRLTNEAPVAGTILSIISSPLQLSGAVYSAYQKITGQEINPYHAAFGPNAMVQVPRETVKNKITAKLGEGTPGDFLLNLGYDVATSSADSMLAGSLGGGTVGAVSLMAGGAASSAIQDAKLRGATDVQALMMGGASFVAESLTEYIPMDKWLKFDGTAATFKKMLGDTAKQFFAEGVGEGVSELLTQAGDNLIMRNLSGWEGRKAEYMRQGMSEDEAAAQAWKDSASDTLYAALAGSISGGFSTAAKYAAQTVSRANAANITEDTVESSGAEPEIITPEHGESSGSEPEKIPSENGKNSEAEPFMEDSFAPDADAAAETQKQLDILSRQVAALTMAEETTDEAAQAATVGAVLSPAAPTITTTSASAVAAQHIISQYGTGGISTVRDMLLTAAETGTDAESVKTSLVTAALHESGKARQVLDSAVAGGVTAETLPALLAAAQEDLSAPGTAEQLNKRIEDSQVAIRVAQLVADGALEGIRSYEDALTQTRLNLRNAQHGLETAQARHTATAQSLQSVSAQFVAEPANQMLRGAVQQATKDVEGAVQVVLEYRQSAANAEAAVRNAETTLNTVRDSTMRRIRQQARAEVSQAKETARQLEEQATAAQNAPTEAATAQAESETAGKGKKVSRFQGNPNTQQEQSDTQEHPKKSPFAIAKKLAGKLGIGDAIGTRKMDHLPQTVLGFYNPYAKYIAVRSKQAGNPEVVFHEIFHDLSHKLNMTGTQEMVNNLDPGFAANYSPAELPGEAFAEFGRMYMADEAKARSFAGDLFVDAFERELRKAGLYKDVHQAAVELRAWLNAANAGEQIGATIRNKSDRPSEGGLRKRIGEMISKLVDDTAAAEKVDKAVRDSGGNADLRSNALMKNFASRRAYAILTENLTDANWTVTGESLAARLEKAGITAKNEQMLMQYWLALHSLDRDAQGKPVFDTHITLAARQAFIDEVRQKHPEVVAGEQAIQEFRKEFLQAFMVDTGFLSQEAFDNMNAMYPHYAPTFRVKNQGAGKAFRSSKRYQIRAATGSTEDIINPMDSFVSMVDSVVTMVSANNAALAWDRAYHSTEGLGVYGREITPDMRQVSVDVSELQAQIAQLLAGNTQDDIFQQVIDLIGTRQTQWVPQQGSSVPNVLTVQHPDGTRSYYEMKDPELYKLLTSQRDGGISAFRTLGKLTRAMSALTTGSNPVFALRNFLRDFQSSTNYGSWASNYITGLGKWLRSAYDVWRGKGEYKDYVALGGGGWTRIEAGTKKGAEDYRAALYKGYDRSTPGRALKWAGKKLWNTVTLARLNEIVEQTSRYAEYKYGQHDKSTAEGRQEAFLAAQDVTVDFARTGNSQTASVLKQFIPFFGASLQGVYRTGRMLSEAERARAPQRFAKTVMNTALMSAITAAIMLKFSDDDEKEAFELMSDDLKSKHFYLPNFAPEVFGQQPLIRIPLAQDPLTYAVHGAVTNALWSGTADGPVIELADIANTIVDNLNPVGSGTIFQPILGVGQNRNWYGSRIVPSYMDKWDPSTQYTEETPQIFIDLGRAVNKSPLKLQYLAEQYTGFLGQMAIPALSKDANTGELGGIRAAIAAARKKLTSDPLISNDVVGSFYDGYNVIETVATATKNDRPLNMLRRGLSPEEASAAYQEAFDLTHAGGILYDTKKAISEMYDEIDGINANQTLTDEQKYKLTSDVRREMIATTLIAQEAIGAFRDKYITGRNIVTDILFAGEYAAIPTAMDKLDATFKKDSDQLYMLHATSVWQATGEASALPHPNTSFSSAGVTYEIGEEEWEDWTFQYKLAYQESLMKNEAAWESMDAEDQLEALQQAHRDGHNKAKDWYKKVHGIK